MDIFNIISGICSIIGVIISLISLVLVTSIKIQQTKKDIIQNNVNKGNSKNLKQTNINKR